MKKTIDGKLYNTETAIEIGAVENPHCQYQNDFQYWKASLYMTPRSKTFFIVGEGGPMSPFGSQTGENSWGWGDRLIPMEKAKALEWAEEYLESEDYKEYFSDIIEEV